MVPLSVRIRCWFWLPLLQATWSYRRMQSLGWLLVARPVVRWARGEGEREQLTRLLVHFNTHPFLAPLLMGSALSVLRPGQDSDQAGIEAGTRLVRWMGTFGALGDMLYWRTLMWNLGWLAAAAWILGGPAALAALALAWLLLELVARILLFELGLQRPETMTPLVQRLANPRLRGRLNRLALVMVAPVSGYAFGLAIQAGPVAWQVDMLGLLACLAAVPLAYKTRFRSTVFWLPILAGLAWHLLQTG